MNKTCDQHMEIISDRLDEEVALPKAALDHLAECDECRAFHDMWQEDTGTLANIAGIRDLPEVPASLADDLSAARKTVTGPWSRKPRPWWTAIAAALVLAAGMAWWNAGNSHVARNPIAEGEPDQKDTVELPLRISEINTSRVEQGLAVYTEVRTRSLDRRSHRLARLAVNMREFATNFSELVPTVE